ncbi:Roadkill [Aphelenchoides besseyi]|nr:Roadkill [Aphelenchoides besseyi]
MSTTTVLNWDLAAVEGEQNEKRNARWLKSPSGVAVNLAVRTEHLGINSQGNFVNWKFWIAEFGSCSLVAFRLKAWIECDRDYRFDFEGRRIVYGFSICFPDNELRRLTPKNAQLELRSEVGEKYSGYQQIVFFLEVHVCGQERKYEPSASMFQQNWIKAFDSEKDADVTVKVDSQSFRVSKQVITTQSEIFERMFAHPTVESQTNVIEIKDVGFETTKKLFEFLCTGQVRDFDSCAFELLKLAVQYQLKELAEICAKSMTDNLSVETAVDCLEIAIMYGDQLDHFKWHVLNFAQRHMDKIIRTTEWQFLWEQNVDIMTEIMNFKS